MQRPGLLRDRHHRLGDGRQHRPSISLDNGNTVLELLGSRYQRRRLVPARPDAPDPRRRDRRELQQRPAPATSASRCSATRPATDVLTRTRPYWKAPASAGAFRSRPVKPRRRFRRVFRSFSEPSGGSCWSHGGTCRELRRRVLLAGRARGGCARARSTDRCLARRRRSLPRIGADSRGRGRPLPLRGHRRCDPPGRGAGARAVRAPARSHRQLP